MRQGVYRVTTSQSQTLSLLESVCEKKGLNYIMNSMSHRIDYGKRGDCHRT